MASSEIKEFENKIDKRVYILWETIVGVISVPPTIFIICVILESKKIGYLFLLLFVFWIAMKIADVITKIYRFYLIEIRLKRMVKREINERNRVLSEEKEEQKRLANLVDYSEIATRLNERIQIESYSPIPISKRETVLLPTDKHYSFLSSELKDTRNEVSQIFLRSRIADLLPSFRKVILNGEDYSMYDLVSAINSIAIECTRKSLRQTPIKDILTKYVTDIGYYTYALNHQYLFSEKKVFTEGLNELIKNYQISKKGFLGEDKVAKHLELYNDILHIKRNIRFYIDGQSVETDCLVVCDNGIFAIEIKNYGSEGDTIHISKDGKWTMNRGGNKSPIKDVVEQNSRHCAIKQKIINESLKKKSFDIPYIPVNSIIVVANDDVVIDNNSDNIVLRTSNIYNCISKFEHKLSKDLQEEILNIIDEHSQPPLKYPVSEYKQELVTAFKNMINLTEYLTSIREIEDAYYNTVYDLYGIMVKGSKLVIDGDI